MSMKYFLIGCLLSIILYPIYSTIIMDWYLNTKYSISDCQPCDELCVNRKVYQYKESLSNELDDRFKLLKQNIRLEDE